MKKFSTPIPYMKHDITDQDIKYVVEVLKKTLLHKAQWLKKLKSQWQILQTKNME